MILLSSVFNSIFIQGKMTKLNFKIKQLRNVDLSQTAMLIKVNLNILLDKLIFKLFEFFYYYYRRFLSYIPMFNVPIGLRSLGV